MLHFFPLFAKDLDSTPFGAELRRLGVQHRFLGAVINMRYRSVTRLVLIVYPRLAWFALGSAIRSLMLSDPLPTAAILGTDVQVLMFGLLRRLLRRRTLIVFQSFIITPRAPGVVALLHRMWYGMITRLTDLAICHSRVEVERYAKLFPAARTRFAFVPLGGTVIGLEALIAARRNRPSGHTIVTAGRSGRDYPTLVKAINGLDCRLEILCDVEASLAGVRESHQVSILRGCFGRDYIERLAAALFVVVPLAVDGISAGQMVLLQATALSQAVILTRTTTTTDYATDGENALLVEIGDVAGLRAAIRRLLDDAEYREALGAKAYRHFERNHSTEAFVRNLVAVIGQGTTGAALTQPAPTPV